MIQIVSFFFRTEVDDSNSVRIMDVARWFEWKSFSTRTAPPYCRGRHGSAAAPAVHACSRQRPNAIILINACIERPIAGSSTTGRLQLGQLAFLFCLYAI